MVQKPRCVPKKNTVCQSDDRRSAEKNPALHVSGVEKNPDVSHTVFFRRNFFFLENKKFKIFFIESVKVHFFYFFSFRLKAFKSRFITVLKIVLPFNRLYI